MLPDPITNPLELMQTDREAARERQDPTADFACFATVDGHGQPHARFVTLRGIDGVHVTFWANDTSPKLDHLRTNGRYELTAHWPTLARQYRLQGAYEWIPASELLGEHEARPWRAKVWDWVYEEVPQSAPAPDRSSFVAKFESRSIDLERAFGGQGAVPPPASAGLVRLEPRRVEVQEIDTERRLHDRRLLVRRGELWTQVVLVP